jgi:hypothetical protein
MLLRYIKLFAWVIVAPVAVGLCAGQLYYMVSTL